jgi:hypothetical protein
VEPFFWFKSGQNIIYLRKPLYQNSLLSSLDKIEGAKDRTRIRIKCVRDTSMVEVFVMKCRYEKNLPASAKGPAHWAFLVSAIMEHHGISHYGVMAAVENKNKEKGMVLSKLPGRGEYNLAEYLARKVADEFSGNIWDRKFLIRVARFIKSIHDLGWYFPNPSGDDIWVRYTDEGTHELRLSNLSSMRRFSHGDNEIRIKNLFEIWKVLPISQADGQVLSEEYLRFSRRLIPESESWAEKFSQWQLRSV